jgi:MSHA biogenesis protein MshP
MSTTCLDRHGRHGRCGRRGHDRRQGRHPRRAARGFAALLALVVLAALLLLGAAMTSLTQRHQLGAAAELQAAQALQAARAGLEWGAFQVLRLPAPPAAAPACFAPADISLPPFTVSVRCSRSPANGTLTDGPDELVFYALEATACNAPSTGACPASGSLADGYVERRLTWTLAR